MQNGWATQIQEYHRLVTEPFDTTKSRRHFPMRRLTIIMKNRLDTGMNGSTKTETTYIHSFSTGYNAYYPDGSNVEQAYYLNKRRTTGDYTRLTATAGSLNVKQVQRYT